MAFNSSFIDIYEGNRIYVKILITVTSYAIKGFENYD